MTILQPLVRRFMLAIAATTFAMGADAQYKPSDEIRQSQTEFQDSKFGIFIHWGLYSMLGDGEWVMNNKDINHKEYAHLADGFCPARFNADEWVKAFKAAGAKYITFTSRHHDGFSMFATKTSKYNVVDGTPFRRDVLKEIADACHRHGLDLHVYYSHLDWYRTDYPLGRTGRNLGRPTDKQDYAGYLGFMKSQLTEILTGYGPIRAIWFDGVWDHDEDATPFDWRLREQYDLIHRLQPSCMVANNHHGKPFEGEDIQIFEQDLPGENTYGLSGQDISPLPLETCLTMNRKWGYSITDKQYKSVDNLIRELVRAAGKNCNLLLNVGPRPDGQLPAEAIERLQAIGNWLQANGETVYGTRAGIVAPHPWGVTTQKGNRLFVHILSHADRSLFLPVPARRVAKARMYNGDAKVVAQATRDGVLLQLPDVPSGVDTIVELTLKD